MGLFDTMTVAENIGVSSSFGARALLPIHRRSEIRIAEQTLGKLGITIDPRTVLGDLAPTERAAVGIARALRECRHQYMPLGTAGWFGMYEALQAANGQRNELRIAFATVDASNLHIPVEVPNYQNSLLKLFGVGS